MKTKEISQDFIRTKNLMVWQLSNSKLAAILPFTRMYLATHGWLSTFTYTGRYIELFAFLKDVL